MPWYTVLAIYFIVWWLVFFTAIPAGDVARAECTPLHRGRTTMVWQTRITRGDGRLAAVVTQTQLVTQARG